MPEMLSGVAVRISLNFSVRRQFDLNGENESAGGYTLSIAARRQAISLCKRHTSAPAANRNGLVTPVDQGPAYPSS